MNQDNEPIQLTQQEEEFCNLYIYGGSDYAGKASKCYTAVFGEKNKYPHAAARYLLSKPHIQSHIKELNTVFQSEDETIAVKLQVTETLKAIMEETATAQFIDKWGISLSPAPLRAVSVNAAKALMEIYPIKHVQETKLKIEGANGDVVFNVIVPENTNKNET